MSNQQAANKPAGKQFLLSMLLPVIESQLDKDRAMQLQGLYVRLKSNDINKDEFARLMRSLVGDHMIKMAAFKLQQGQSKLTRQVVSGIGTGADGKLVSEIEHEETDVGKGDVEGPMVAGGVLIGSKKPGEQKLGATKDSCAGVPDTSKREQASEHKKRKVAVMMQDFKEKRNIKLAAGDTQLTGDRRGMEADIVKPDNLLPLAAGKGVGHSTWVDMMVARVDNIEKIINDNKVKEQNLTNELNVSRKELKEKDEQLKAAVNMLKQREADLAKVEMDYSATIGALTGDVVRLKEERRWLITEGIPRSFEVIRGSVEFRNAIAELAACADFVGRQDGMRDGIKLQQSGKRIEEHEHYKVDVEGDLANAYLTFSGVCFPMMEELVSTADHEDLDTLKALLASPIYDGSLGQNRI